MKRHVAVLSLISALLAAPDAATGAEGLLEWYGHAFVRLTCPEGVRVAMDPFGEIGYPMPEASDTEMNRIALIRAVLERRD
ncbi:MAG: hypothetical protein HYR51_05055 [Candidatus Rokubacteria bacterium]|nr:hypothetical protein [Candidatus Rokubacteria bacterium]